MSNEFLSCDWGTSNFRLRLVSLPGLDIIAEESSDEGIEKTYKAWQASGEADNDKKVSFYQQVIHLHIKKLEAAAGRQLDNIAIVVSGMASSSIGFADLPYQKLPFKTDGSDLHARSFPPSKGFNHELLLISGVKSDNDVMRGEETQLIGCITDDINNYKGAQLIIHPGTHSKHITIADNQATAFQTYMTGEFFKLLTTHSILRGNVAITSKFDAAHFEQGVGHAEGTNLLHECFLVRTNDLFQRLSKEDNYLYLSGLLIGYELKELKNSTARIVLCCGANLTEQYTTAINASGLQDKINILPSKWVDESVIRGQAKIFNRYKNIHHE